MRPPIVQANKVHFQPWFVMPPSVGSTGTLFVNIRPNGSSCRPADHLESAHIHTQHIISASQHPPNNWHLCYPAFCVFTLSTDKCCLQRHTLCPHSPKLAFVHDDFLNAFRPRGINRFLWEKWGEEWCKQERHSRALHQWVSARAIHASRFTVSLLLSFFQFLSRFLNFL